MGKISCIIDDQYISDYREFLESSFKTIYAIEPTKLKASNINSTLVVYPQRYTK